MLLAGQIPSPQGTTAFTHGWHCWRAASVGIAQTLYFAASPILRNDRGSKTRNPGGDYKPTKPVKLWTGRIRAARLAVRSYEPPMPFNYPIAASTDRLGARGWTYIAANVSPIG